MKIAVTTKSGMLIDEHFGRAETLTVYDVDAESGTVLGTQARAGLGACVCKGNDGSGHDDEQVADVLNSLADCRYVLTARIGPHMVRELAKINVAAFELVSEIEPALAKIVQYEQKYQSRSIQK